jgi:hypothetical protein
MKNSLNLLRLLIIISLSTLFIIIALQLTLTIFFKEQQTKTLPLNELVPESIPGWKSTEIPIAQTEELRERVATFLNFDDYLSRSYTKGQDHINIYIAYWSPEKTTPRLVGAHTPDTCWVQNGWTQEFRQHDVERQLNDISIKPLEYGTYKKDGVSENVIFWHIVGGRIYAYDQSNLHDIYAVFKDIKTFGLRQKREQFFIRISSNLPLELLWKEPGFEYLMKSVAELGLYEPHVD